MGPTFGQRLEATLGLLGKGRGSKAALAKKLGVSARTVSRWLGDQLPCGPDRRRQIEVVLGLDSGWLDLVWADLNSLNLALSSSGRLRKGSGTPDIGNRVHEAPIDYDGIPKHLRLPTESQEAGEMIAQRAGTAFTTALDENEVGGTREGRAWLVGQLIRLQQEFRAVNHDPGAFADAIDFILTVDRPPSTAEQKGKSQWTKANKRSS